MADFSQGKVQQPRDKATEKALLAGAHALFDLGFDAGLKAAGAGIHEDLGTPPSGTVRILLEVVWDDGCSQRSIATLPEEHVAGLLKEVHAGQQQAHAQHHEEAE